MGRLWRTIRPLSATQLLRRLRLRARAAAGRGFPAAAARTAAVRAGPLPRPRPPSTPPLDLLLPCDPEVVERRAAQAERGEFEFLGVRRELGERPFPAPRDLPLLWAYHLEYMDYLVDLSSRGRTAAVARLVGARLGSEGTARISANHPYPDSRRTASWARVLAMGGGGEARGQVAHGVWTWAHRVLANREFDVGGNHLLENGLALVLAGAAFRGRRAARLLRAGERILAAGAREQVHADGGHYELSPLYHARVLSVLLEGGLALGGAGLPPGETYWDAVGRMTGFLGGILDPDGQLPLLGDTVREEGLEPPRLLCAAAGRLPVPVPARARGDRDYPDTGLTVLEDPAERHRLLLDAGPTCPDRLPAHGQADTFTFELHVDGRPIVVDPGVFEYAPGEMRDYGRSTRAHSTVEVDGEDSSEVWASFRVGRRARVRERRFRVDRERGSLSAEHDGYGHRGVIHRRSVSHLEPGLWLVADSMAGAGPHRYASRIHFHPEAILERPADGSYTVHLAGTVLRVVPYGPVRVSVEDGWHSPAFGVRRRTQVLRADSGGGCAAFGWALAAGAGPAPAVRGEGGLVTVERGGRRHARASP